MLGLTKNIPIINLKLKFRLTVSLTQGWILTSWKILHTNQGELKDIVFMKNYEK